MEKIVKRVVGYSAIGFNIFVDWEVEEIFYGWISKGRNERSGPGRGGLIYLIWISTPVRSLSIARRCIASPSLENTNHPGKANVSGLEFVFRNPMPLSDLSGVYPEN